MKASSHHSLSQDITPLPPEKHHNARSIPARGRTAPTSTLLDCSLHLEAQTLNVTNVISSVAQICTICTNAGVALAASAECVLTFISLTWSVRR
jgi:hypothetical protein